MDLEQLVYLGWPLFRWINRFFTIYVFDWLTQLGLSMGIVLLLITILLRIIVYPTTKKSYLSSAKMRVLKPKVDEITKKYPNPEDNMKKQQEEYKVNLIGEQDLRKLTKEELELLVAAFVKAMSIEKCNHDKDK